MAAVECLAPAKSPCGAGVLGFGALWGVFLVAGGVFLAQHQRSVKCQTVCSSSALCWNSTVPGTPQLCVGAAGQCINGCLDLSNVSNARHASSLCYDSRCSKACAADQFDCQVKCSGACDVEAKVPLAQARADACVQQRGCDAVQAQESKAVSDCVARCPKPQGGSVLAVLRLAALPMFATLSLVFYKEAFSCPRCTPLPACAEVAGRVALYVSGFGAAGLLLYLGVMQVSFLNDGSVAGSWADLGILVVVIYASVINLVFTVLAGLSRCCLATQYEPLLSAQP